LRRDRAVADVQKQGLVGTQAPRLAEAALEVLRGERPERGVPGGAFTRRFLGPGGDVPALHDLAQEAVAREPLAVHPRQVPGPYGDPTLALKLFQELERGGEML
jgi:hypothetical protein